jgi:hypothetical protein
MTVLLRPALRDPRTRGRTPKQSAPFVLDPWSIVCVFVFYRYGHRVVGLHHFVVLLFAI